MNQRSTTTDGAHDGHDEFCQIVIVGADGLAIWQANDWTSVVALASLSADPYTLGEFTAAVQRYLADFAGPEQLADFSMEAGHAGDAPAVDWEVIRRASHLKRHSSWCVIDLVGRTIVANEAFELPGRRAAYQTEAPIPEDAFPIVWIDLARDWVLETVTDCHATHALQERHIAARSERPCDVRAVLWGDPCWEFMVEQIMQVPNEDLVNVKHYDDGDLYEGERTRAIHRQWLMTPRTDLGGLTPRQIMLRDRERLNYDLEHRSEQWSRQGFAPPPLAPHDHAYRFGNFGTTEIVTYFLAIRTVLNDAWKWRKDYPATTASDLLEFCLGQLDDWLHQLNLHDESLTPEEQIELERQRLPRIVQAHEVFDDCPLCRAQAEGAFGPTFVWVDGHELEMQGDFAFSLLDDYDDWYSLQDMDDVSDNDEEPTESRGATALVTWGDEEVQSPRSTAALEMHPGKLDLALADQDLALNVDRGRDVTANEADDSLDNEEVSVWRRCSLQGWDALIGPQGSAETRCLALGFPIAELSEDLKQLSGSSVLRQALSDSYVEFTRVTDTALLPSVGSRLRETLEEVAREYPHLVSKSADLQGRLDEVLRQAV